MPLVFWCFKKKTSLANWSHITRISLVTSSGHTHLHRHRKHWASVTDVRPTLTQHWFNASCLLRSAIIGLEQFGASVNVRQWWDSYGSLAIRLIKCPYIAYRASPLWPLSKTYTRRSANVRPALQTVSKHICILT